MILNNRLAQGFSSIQAAIMRFEVLEVEEIDPTDFYLNPNGLSNMDLDQNEVLMSGVYNGIPLNGQSFGQLP